MKGLVLALASIFSVTALFGQENHGYNIEEMTYSSSLRV